MHDRAEKNPFACITGGGAARVLHVTVPPDYPKDGGYLRSRQIADALRAAGRGYVYCPLFHLRFALSRDLFGVLDYLRRNLPSAVFAWDEPSLRSTLKAFLAVRAARPGSGDLAVFDIPGEYISPWLVRWLRRRGVRVVIAPHNIEALAHIRRTTRRSQRIELSSWAEADASLFTTQDDNNYAIKHGCKNADVFGYWPPAEQRALLQAIRRERPSRPKRHVLVLGSTNNPPTKVGMEAQIAAIAQMERPSLPFVFAGSGTETLRPSGGPVELRGRVSDDALRELYLEAAVMWVAQPKATGVLTRIADAIEAGIPVLANRFAARGYDHANDVTIYEDDGFSAALLARFVDSAANLRIGWSEEMAAEFQIRDAL